MAAYFRSRALALMLGVLVAGPACHSDEPGTDPGNGNGNGAGREYIAEVIVMPSGTAGPVYWTWSAGEGWKVHSDIAGFPNSAVTAFTLIQPGSSNASGITGPGTAAVDTTINALFTGGRGANNAPASGAAGLYTGEDSAWIRLQMTEPRRQHAASIISNQRVLITGGFGASAPSLPLNTAEVFTLASRTFAVADSMHIARAEHASATLEDGRVLIMGGITPTDAGAVTTIEVASTEIYQPANGRFTDGPLMTLPRSTHRAITLDDGRVLVLGGRQHRSAEIYTPGTGAFTRVSDMFVVRGNGHAAVKLPTGRVLVMGGATASNEPTSFLEQFDPATNNFTNVGNMTTPRTQHFAVLLPDGRVLIGGGRGTGGADLATAEIYDPQTNTSTPIANMPGPTSDQPAVLVRRWIAR
jgi:hypothetical protein